MSKVFDVEIVTPEKTTKIESVSYITLPTKNGSYGVLYGHLPVIVQIETGVCEYTKDGKKQKMLTTGGIADIGRTKISLICDFMENEEVAQQTIQRRQEQYLSNLEKRQNAYAEYKANKMELIKSIEKISGKHQSPNN